MNKKKLEDNYKSIAKKHGLKLVEFSVIKSRNKKYGWYIRGHFSDNDLGRIVLRTASNPSFDNGVNTRLKYAVNQLPESDISKLIALADTVKEVETATWAWCHDNRMEF